MPRPISVDVFIQKPSYEEWLAELRDGWPGPDGSSMSTDKIMGVRIGITGPEYEYADLPANRHDWYYRLGRRYRLPESWRREADRRYRDMCIYLCKLALTGWRRWTVYPIAKARAHARYTALRTAARFAWTGKAKARAEAWNGAP